MDGILKSSEPLKAAVTEKSDAFRFLFPGARTWELWDKTPAGTVERIRETDPAREGSRWKARSFLAVPAQYTVVIPLWLPTTERTLMDDMVWMQLENRGVLSGSREKTVMDYRLVREENGRSLLSVCVMPDDFPSELCRKDISRYHLDADLLDLPSDQLVVWKGLNRQVCVFTSGKEVVYIQSYFNSILEDHLIHETACAFFQLQSEGVLPCCFGVTAFGDYSHEELKPLGEGLGVPVSIQRSAILRIPKTLRNLIPYPVRVWQEGRIRRARSLRIWTIVGAVYLLGVAAACGYVGNLFWKKQKIEQNLALHRSEVQEIQNTARRWEALGLALVPETYVVEMFYRCVRQLPGDGVRLVTYEQDGTRVLMTGEAKNSSAAFQYLQDLKKSEELAVYKWEMPPPKLLPNDAAQFQIEGKRSYAPIYPQ